jgi:hypothetical protein
MRSATLRFNRRQAARRLFQQIVLETRGLPRQRRDLKSTRDACGPRLAVRLNWATCEIDIAVTGRLIETSPGLGAHASRVLLS